MSGVSVMTISGSMCALWLLPCLCLVWLWRACLCVNILSDALLLRSSNILSDTLLRSWLLASDLWADVFSADGLTSPLLLFLLLDVTAITLSADSSDPAGCIRHKNRVNPMMQAAAEAYLIARMRALTFWPGALPALIRRSYSATPSSSSVMNFP